MKNTHPVYKLGDGTVVPSATQVLKIISKGGLAPAANKLGLQGINSNVYWNDLAEVGTIAHHLIACHLKKAKPDLSNCRKFQIDKAENSFLSYLEWEKGHKIEPVILETPMVSESLRFGGTPDCVCHLDGSSDLTLIDFKTGGIYDEAYYQVSAYSELLIDNGHRVANAIVLGIPRTLDESFDEVKFDSFHAGFMIFKKCLDLYTAIAEYKHLNKTK